MSKGLHKNSLRKGDNPHQWMIDDARQKVIQQIRAEVDRLENYYTSVEWYVEALLSFLDTFGTTEKSSAVEQPEGIIAQIENYPVIEEPVTAEELRKLDDELHGEQSEKVSRDEQIALSIMAYLDTHIKNDKNLVLRGVTLQDAREWIREQIQTKQPVCKELEEEINNWIGGPDAFCEGVGITPLPKAMEIAERCARHFAQWGENRGKVGPIHEKCSRCPLEDTSEDLENASVNYADEHESDYIGTGEEDDATYWMARKAFKAGANWQKEKDTRDMIMSDCSYFQNCYELGKKDMKEQMMKDYISKETAKKIARGSLGVQDFIRKIDRHTEDKQ